MDDPFSPDPRLPRQEIPPGPRLTSVRPRRVRDPLAVKIQLLGLACGLLLGLCLFLTLVLR